MRKWQESQERQDQQLKKKVQGDLSEEMENYYKVRILPLV